MDLPQLDSLADELASEIDVAAAKISHQRTRWRAAAIKVCDMATGGLFAFTLAYGSSWCALGALVTLLTSMMLDAGEPQPGDPPKGD